MRATLFGHSLAKCPGSLQCLQSIGMAFWRRVASMSIGAGTLETRTGTPGYCDVRGVGIGAKGWTRNVALGVGKVGRTFREGIIARWVPWKAWFAVQLALNIHAALYHPSDCHPQVSLAPALLSNPEYLYPGLSGTSLWLTDHLHTLPPQSTPKTHQYNHPPLSFPDNSV